MLRTFFFVLLLLSIAEASVSQGKLIYTKECLQCHLNGKALSSHKTAQKWKELFNIYNKTNELAQTHLNTKKAKSSWPYFHNASYQKDSKHLKDFMQKYSSDRGRHNSCN